MSEKQQKRDKAVFGLTQSLAKMAQDNLQSAQDLILDRMKKKGQMPDKGAPIFVDNHGNPIMDQEKTPMKDVPLPDPKQIRYIEIDGMPFPWSGVGPLDAITVLTYVVTQVLAKENPRVDAALRSVAGSGFVFKDATGKVVYPFEALPPTKKSHAKRKSNKRRA